MITINNIADAFASVEADDFRAAILRVNPADHQSMLLWTDEFVWGEDKEMLWGARVIPDDSIQVDGLAVEAEDLSLESDEQIVAIEYWLRGAGPFTTMVKASEAAG